MCLIILKWWTSKCIDWKSRYTLIMMSIMCCVKLSFDLTRFQSLDIKLQRCRTYRYIDKFTETNCTSPQSRNPWGALTFRRWYVCNAIKTPIFSITLTQRPHIFFTISPKDPLFFHKFVCCHPKSSFFQKKWNFDAKWRPVFRNEKPFFLQIGSYFHRKVAKFGKSLRNFVFLFSFLYYSCNSIVLDVSNFFKDTRAKSG